MKKRFAIYLVFIVIATIYAWQLRLYYGCIVRNGERIIAVANSPGSFFVRGNDGAEYLVTAGGGRFQLGSDMTDNYTPPSGIRFYLAARIATLIGAVAILLRLLAECLRSPRRAEQIGAWCREIDNEWERAKSPQRSSQIAVWRRGTGGKWEFVDGK